MLDHAFFPLVQALKKCNEQDEGVTHCVGQTVHVLYNLMNSQIQRDNIISSCISLSLSLTHTNDPLLLHVVLLLLSHTQTRTRSTVHQKTFAILAATIPVYQMCK